MLGRNFFAVISPSRAMLGAPFTGESRRISGFCSNYPDGPSTVLLTRQSALAGFYYESMTLSPSTAVNLKFICGLAIILSGAVLLTGCHGIGTQRFTAFAPTQSHELETSSRVVLDVTVRQQTAMADYNLWDNLSMLAPKSEHWKFDATWQVDRVVKGKFEDTTLELHWLREPTKEQCDLLGISPMPAAGFINGTPLRIGFDSLWGKELRNLKITTRP